ncbi:MAG: DUF4296 domain-containing protein [Bacteroidota bacterium]
MKQTCRNYLLLSLLLFALLSGCAKKQRITGSYFVPRDVMVSVLADIYLLDGITDSYKFYRSYSATDSIDMHSVIFEKYGITREQFDSTLNEYSQYPELLDKVYDEVIMNLNLMQDSLDIKTQAKKEGLKVEEEPEKAPVKVKVNRN